MRIAVLGLGFMGTTHLKAWRQVPDARVAAVFSGDARKLTGDLSGAGGNLGGSGEVFDFSEVGKFTSIEALLADENIDAVDICLPTDLHATTASAALRCGKHVLVEKPMALDGASADNLLREAEASGRVLMAAHVLRFIPAYQALADALAKSGDPVAAYFARRCAAPSWSAWLGDAQRSGGGVFDLLIHDADYCLKLFGKPAEVSATGTVKLARGLDLLTAQLYYETNLVVTIAGGWFPGDEFPFAMEYLASTRESSFAWASNRDPARVHSYERGRPAASFMLPEMDGFTAELQYFAQVCRSGQRPDLCPPEDSAAAVKLMLLLIEARTRNGEKLPCRI